MNRLLTLFFVTLLAGSTLPAQARDSVSRPSGMGYTCTTVGCQCSGDDDCNRMFSDGVCGTVAECNDDTGICSCLRFRPVQPRRLPDLRVPGTIFSPAQ